MLYSWVDPANLRNRDLRARDKRGMNVYVNTFEILFEGHNTKILLCFQAVFMNDFIFVDSSP
jgi:hypothetical protein